MSDDMDEESFLRFVYSHVKANPGLGPMLTAYAREAVEERLRQAQAQITDTEAALVLELQTPKRRKRRVLKPESADKLRKWVGRHAFAWDELK